MKRIGILLILMVGFVINASEVEATTKRGQANVSYSQCLKFQDARVTISKSINFGHCVRVSCPSGQWRTQFWLGGASNVHSLVTCSNGNRNKFVQIISDGCSGFVGSCTPTTQIRYCTLVVNYDCTRTANGSKFTTTTKRRTTTTTRRPIPRPPGTTTTTTTTTTKPVIKSDNNFLTGIELSEGVLDFKRDKFEYTVIINEDVTEIEVIVTPEHPMATAIIENNRNIDVDVPILIKVIAENMDERVYTINLKHGEDHTSNARLASLTVDGKDIGFDPDLFTYTIRVKRSRPLNIEFETMNPIANVAIIGNSNLTNGSKINIIVTTEDFSEMTYLINVEKSSNTFTSYLIVIIILGVAGFVGSKLVIRFLQQKEGESSYEYE